MFRLAKFSQFVFCLVGIVLTCLFSLSLAGIDVDGLSSSDHSMAMLFLAGVFIVIDVCIDIGKYLFWFHRHRGLLSSLLSVVLMLFS